MYIHVAYNRIALNPKEIPRYTGNNLYSLPPMIKFNGLSDPRTLPPLNLNYK
jgi:hypothetical protein